MKKIMFLLVFVCLTAGFLFAQDYTVQTVTGRVLKGTGHDKVNIIEGEVLTAGTIISISAGASLVLTDGEHTYTITPGYTGRVFHSPQVARTRREPAVRTDRRPSRSIQVSEPAHAAEEAHLDIVAEEPPEPLGEILSGNEHIEIIIEIDADAETEENH